MIFLEINLKPVGSILQYRKAGLAESPQCDDSSRKGAGYLLFFQDLFGFLGMERDELARAILHVESSAVRRDARFTQGVEFFDALLLLLVQFVHHCFGLEGRFIHRL